MKQTLLIAMVLLFSTAAFAKDLASYRFAIRTDDGNSRSIIHQMVTTVTDEGEMTVVLNTSGGNFPFFTEDRSNEKTFAKTLNKHVFKLLENDIKRLSNAEIEKRTNQIVCMMMQGPMSSNNHLSVLRGFDYNSKSYLGEMELVDGPHGCWVRSATYPKNTYDRATAASLKALMKALTLDHIGQDIE